MTAVDEIRERYALKGITQEVSQVEMQQIRERFASGEISEETYQTAAAGNRLWWAVRQVSTIATLTMMENK